MTSQLGIDKVFIKQMESEEKTWFIRQSFSTSWVLCPLPQHVLLTTPTRNSLKHVVSCIKEAFHIIIFTYVVLLQFTMNK